MKKLVFCCLPGLSNFVEPIAEYMKRFYNTKLVVGNSLQEYAAEISDADIIWLEWANQLAGAITQNLLPAAKVKKVILRLHSYEVHTPGLMENINFGNITDILFVSEFVRDYTIGLSPETFKHMNVHTVPNGFDFDSFTIHPDKYKPMDTMTVGLLGHLNNKKGPMLLAQTLAELQDRRPINYIDLKFKIGGTWTDTRHEAYFMHFIEKTGLYKQVEFVKVPYGGANDFFQDVNLVLCTSPWESQNMSVMEGMACGCKPAIHYFPGAEYHYSPANLWLTLQELQEIVYSNPWPIDDFRNQVKRFNMPTVMDELKLTVLDK